MGLLRLLEAALDVYDRCREDPRVEFAAEPQGTDKAFRNATAGSEPATLVTLDKALSKLALRAGTSTLLIANYPA